MPTRMEDLEAAARAAGATEEDIAGEPVDEEVIEDPQADEDEPDEGESSEAPEVNDGAELPEDDDNPYGELPESFFGENIHEYADEHGVEAAEAFYNALQDANRVANSRLQQIAELKKQMEAEAAEQVAPLPEAEAPEQTEPLSDAELLTEYGYDPSMLDTYEDFAKPIVDMLRRQEALERQVATREQENQAEAWERQFWGELDTLQSTHGDLPFDRGALEVLATERKVFDPNALYWSIMGPIKEAAAKGTKPKPKGDQALKDLKRTVGKSSRKRSTAAGKTSEKTKGMTLAESYAAAKKETGTDGDPFTF